MSVSVASISTWARWIDEFAIPRQLALPKHLLLTSAGGSDSCASRGYDFALLPSGREWLAFATTAFIIINVVINVALGAVSRLHLGRNDGYSGRIQNRSGPNRLGAVRHVHPRLPTQSKTLFKEDIVPDEADRWLFNLAPILMVVAGFDGSVGDPVRAAGTFVVDLNIGILFRDRDYFAVGHISGFGFLGIGPTASRYSPGCDRWRC